MFEGGDAGEFVLASVVRKLLPEPALVIQGTNAASHFGSKVNILSII